MGRDFTAAKPPPGLRALSSESVPSKKAPKRAFLLGAGNGTRTHDLSLEG